jgi:hypothetical protein
VQNGVYSKGKNEIVYVHPLILSSGLVVFNTLRLGLELHPEIPSAQALDMRYVGVQLLSNSAYSDFWTTGALA